VLQTVLFGCVGGDWVAGVGLGMVQRLP
jgi:hypothetical protein